jgi:hypothetical protein
MGKESAHYVYIHRKATDGSIFYVGRHQWSPKNRQRMEFEMNDMSPVIVPRSDQLNSDSLIAGPITISIREVAIRPGTEQPVSIFYEGDDGNPWKPCKSMARVMVAVWGADSKEYIGRSLTLYRDPTVKWAGVEVGGIRISHMSHMDGPMTMALTATKGSRKPYTVHPLVSATPTAATATAALAGAETMADLETAWKARWMAPFRDELGDLLAERKAILQSPQSPNPDSPPVEGADTVTGRGEDAEKQIGAASSSLWSSLIESAMTATDPADIEVLQATFDANEDEIPLDRQAEVQNAINDAMGRLANV